jgi:predicted nuclease of predicted toxin-antitoxin system
VRFLVDAQLPPALARWLVEQGHDASHVMDHGLGEASDHRIWDEAASSGAVIVTKDEDFPARRRSSAMGPAVVWVRVGNVTRRETPRRFAVVLPDLLAALERGDTLIEIV